MSLWLSFIASLIMHSVTWLSHRKSRTSPNSIPKPLYLFCTSYSLNTIYFWSRLISSIVFILNSDYVYVRKRWVESFEREIKMSREKSKKICVLLCCHGSQHHQHHLGLTGKHMLDCTIVLYQPTHSYFSALFFLTSVLMHLVLSWRWW
jgi:hypothetical protein